MTGRGVASGPLIAAACRGRRQEHGESAAAPDRALDLQSPAVAVHDMLDDGEAEAGAAELPRPRGVPPVEPLGKAWNLLPGDPLPLIAHGDRDEASRRGPADRHGAAVALLGDHAHLGAAPAVFDGIVDQILEYLGKLVPIPEHRRQSAFGESHGNGDLSRLALRLERVGHAAQDAEEVERLRRWRVLAKLDP